ncbi:LapA family protein [Natrononativus amylolyticus]|uniref:LapA family protein n=1 Tax=Natrononativus amylolyticus TaxID=2963434 RepID=UPI0020CBB973|nr:LapA family protein [Natrononativus amylolyticus]
MPLPGFPGGMEALLVLLITVPVGLGAIGGLLYLVTERLQDSREDIDALESRIDTLERRLEES